ncbi:hypothetical protein L596_009591 [Steinernema carpocapsae]|uniref:Uncharacterized protein n=1 Tax=Steinernema carpocapsae TaxID=34508 RepID=A0A4U5PFS7_STECR|nr:hypothetical protein L596_009591 [Steinernema carpocapsae]
MRANLQLVLAVPRQTLHCDSSESACAQFMRFHHACVLLAVIPAVFAASLEDFFPINASEFNRIEFILKRGQYVDKVLTPANNLNQSTEDLIANSGNQLYHDNLISVCNYNNPFASLELLDTHILELNQHSLVVLTLTNSGFSFSEFRNFQLALTKTAYGLLNACTYCESTKSKGQLTERDQQKLKKASERVQNVINQAKAGAKVQREQFWPGYVELAAEAQVKGQLSKVQEPAKIVKSLGSYLTDKYVDPDNYGLQSPRFGVFMHTKSDEIQKKFSGGAEFRMLSFPIKGNAVLNVYRVSQNPVFWVNNHKAYEKHLSDIKIALANATKECIKISSTLDNIFKNAFDAASSIYPFPLFYFVPNKVTRDENWAVENGFYNVDGDSFVHDSQIALCNSNSTFPVHFNVYVGF